MLTVRTTTRKAVVIAATALLALTSVAAPLTSALASPKGVSPQALSGNVIIDGSSTVFPITEAFGEDFGKANKGVQVTIGVSGTGGGFAKFCNGETDIQNASRPIKKSEMKKCKENGIKWSALEVGWDGLTVVVNQSNSFAKCLTKKELKKIWAPGSTVSNWNQVRSSFPNKPLDLYGPGTASGTFDFFTEAINGKGGASRSDYTASENDNVLVQGVAGDSGAMGYFGLAYFKENSSKLNAVKVDNGRGCVAPNSKTVKNKTYKPLSRPLFIYFNKTKVKANPAAKSFLLSSFKPAYAKKIVKSVGYVESSKAVYKKDLKKIAKATK